MKTSTFNEIVNAHYNAGFASFMAAMAHQFPGLTLSAITELYNESYLLLEAKITSGKLTGREINWPAYVTGIGRCLQLRRYREESRMCSIDIYSEPETLNKVNWQMERATAHLSEEVIDKELVEVLYEALKSLGTDKRRILLLFYEEKKSMAEIANIMGYNNSDTAKARKNQCMNQLKKKMAELMEARGFEPSAYFKNKKSPRRA